jgi:hypothetical protein
VRTLHGDQREQVNRKPRFRDTHARRKTSKTAADDNDAML